MIAPRYSLGGIFRGEHRLLVSKCCKSDMFVYTTGESTSFYCCKMCDHGCDAVPQKQEKETLDHGNVFTGTRIHPEERGGTD